MIWLIKWAALGHIHTWETDEWVPLNGNAGAKGRRYYLRCQCCGDVKKRDLI